MDEIARIETDVRVQVRNEQERAVQELEKRVEAVQKQDSSQKADAGNLVDTFF